MSWLTTEPPKNGIPFIANIGYPWAVIAVWNAVNEHYVWAELQVDMFDGIYNDTYFQNEHAKPHELNGWLPMPEIKP